MEHVRRFLAAVLTGIAPTAHLVKVTSDLAKHYTLIVTVADTLPKRLVLSQSLVHAAVSNASARDGLEAALRADLRPEAASKGRRREGGLCAVCGKPIGDDAAHFDLWGRVAHLRCAAPQSAADSDSTETA